MGESTPDHELISAVRKGDTEAYGLLWQHHRLAGIAAARGIAPNYDPDELVAEAFARILEQLSKGNGPRDLFRPYLYQVIKSVAISSAQSTVPLSEDLDIPERETADTPWTDEAFDRSAAAAAFKSLPERWQSVLWYTEVEGLAPRKVASLIGISANSVSALALRARKALRSAWVEKHAAAVSELCSHMVPQLQKLEQGRLTARVRRDVEQHLSTCHDCRSAQTEFRQLNSRLSLVLAGIFVGSSATGLVTAINPQAALAAAAAVGSAATKTGLLVSTSTLLKAAAVVAVTAVGVGVLIHNAVSPSESGVETAAEAVAAPNPTAAGEATAKQGTADETKKKRKARAEEAQAEDSAETPAASNAGGTGEKPRSDKTAPEPTSAPAPPAPPAPEAPAAVNEIPYICAAAEAPGTARFSGDAARAGAVEVAPSGGSTVSTSTTSNWW